MTGDAEGTAFYHEYEGDEIDEDEEEEFDEIIRAKWTFDGSKTLTEAAQMLRSYADYLEELEKDGWKLREEIRDDYGFIYNEDKTKKLSVPA